MPEPVADLSEFTDAQRVTDLENQLRSAETRAERADRQAKVLKSERDEAQRDADQLLGRLELLEELDAVPARKPKPWTVPGHKPGIHRGTVVTMLSDIHLDETVNPNEIDGINAYDREIAVLRMKKYFEHVCSLPRDYITGIEYEGVQMLLGGDVFSGIIHEELLETNTDTLFDSLVFWLDPFVEGFMMLADEFGRVDLEGVVGNHGRQTRKPRAKRRAKDNVEWAFYKLLARELGRDARFSFAIGEAADAHVEVYDKNYLLTHGDQFRGGSGIAGLLSPMMIGNARKREREAYVGNNFDYMIMGHWHQLSHYRNIIVNGSVKGYDEYAYVSNFAPEPAQQAMWVATPEHGMMAWTPIVLEDREAEGW